MEHKQLFEKYLKHPISRTAWYRVRALMSQQSLPLTKPNLKLVARLKTESNRHRLPLPLTLSYYLKTADIDVVTTGENIYHHIQRITDYKPHRTTIQRWFTEYHPSKVYSPSQVSQILLHAFIYKLRNTHNGTQQKSSRSSQISTKEDWSSW